MRCVESVEALRLQVAAWRREGQRIGFVPTMGNLHDGHYSLIRVARERADRVIASVFVNPGQFGPGEDFETYPRTPDADADGLRAANCDLLFQPSVETMYPFGVEQRVAMHVPGLSDILCGASRPGHFDGVATVVARLFNLVQPDVAVFGRKDYQQLAVIRYMVRDLAFPIEVVGAPTQREPDGLAMSSRNQYLNAGQRQQAALINVTLRWMLAELRSARHGSRQEIEAAARERLEQGGFAVDYAAIRSTSLGAPDDASADDVVALIAARLGRTRLIDNMTQSDTVAPDS